MIVIGLTGGIGTGKSVVARILEGLGAEIIDADKVGHEVYEPDREGFHQVVSAFGDEIVGVDGRIDRVKLGKRVFGNEKELQRLTAIVHPQIHAMVEDKIASSRTRGETLAIVLEAAILLDAGWDALTDEVWVVSANAADVRSRLNTGRGLSAEEVDARAAKQMDEEQRRARADVLIENRGSRDDLQSQVEHLWRERVRPAR